MLLVAVELSAAVWAWLLLGHGRFWRSGPALPRRVPERRLRVAAIVPARNEAEGIRAALGSLLQQQGLFDLHVLLVDDNSTDATAALAQELAATDTRLRVLPGAPLPAGWTGKLWAVHGGLQQPEANAADYVLLTDADIVHEPQHLAALLAQAEAGGLGLVSEMVHLHTESFAERALLPAFVFFFQMLYPFSLVNNPRSQVAAAAGGSMLISREALRRIRGVERIRSALIDDVALAREVKREGFALWLGHGDRVRSHRRYLHLGEVWEMIARTAFVQLRYSPLLLAGTVLGMMLLYAVPVLAACVGRGLTRRLGVLCWAGLALAFQPTLRRYRRGRLWGVALPAVAAFYLGATVASAWRFYRGSGGQWKGRTYAVHALSPATDAAVTGD